VLLHIIGDALGSVGVIVTGAIIKHGGDSKYRFLADPICSLFIVALILISTIPLVKETVAILMQLVPDEIDTGMVKKAMYEREAALLNIHDLHIWTLTDNTHIATCHAVVHAGVQSSEAQQIVLGVKHVLHAHGIHSSSVQLEYVAENQALLGYCNEPNCGGPACEERRCCAEG
jgi:cation diffusion facilitator family transporter